MSPRDRFYDEHGYSRPFGLDCLCSGSRAITLWGGTILGSLPKALRDPWLLSGVFDFCKSGDRVFIAGYADEKAWKEEARAAVAELVILRKREAMREASGFYHPPLVEFRVISITDLQATDEPRVLQTEEAAA